ncbi:MULTISPECIES: SseB family protein [Streptomyces]|uniref:SseB family protein n=1 Tax=Streptomyces lonegramiae TaxID=3075524 RepID=A0ABU2XSQ2_9ACTN|nr:SseB family protein [Streptomyces sp. DSM 41529]MDT0548949.1 SseB family protein [Streptomyces sp. DSM 41529]
MELAEHIAAVRAGAGDPAAMVGEFRRTAVLVPVADDGFMTAEYGGIRWIYAFTDESALARFATARGSAPGQEWEYAAVLGARLLDVMVPEMGRPAGVAVDVADEDGSMMFPPVRGIVPDEVAVDMDDDGADGGVGGERAQGAGQ